MSLLRVLFLSLLRVEERLMAGRSMAGSPKSLDLCSVSFAAAGRRCRRRTLAAFVTGAALFAASGVALQSDFAGASTGGGGFFAVLSAVFAPPPAEIPADAAKPVKRAPAAARGFAPRRPVCVRLCDGFFFPVNSFSGLSLIASEKASCAALCPDAPAALYFLPAGSDKIEDAVSASGQRYTALPVSLRYRTALDNTCACRRAIGQNPPYWQDPTLRKGDAVMTPDGFLVFAGAGRSPDRRGDFVALAAAAMPGDRRAALTAIERASTRAAYGADRFRIAAAATRPSDKSRGANEIRFAAPLASVTN
jgi:hypothetical protein